MPTYNRADLVGRAIRSVLEQSYTNLTLHLVDDGSTDNTRKMVEPFTQDTRFYYHYQDNQGQSAARNKGIFDSPGELIAFLDSDNYWLPEKLESQLNFFRRFSGFDVIYSDGYSVDENDKRLPGKPVKRYSGNILPQLLVQNFVSNNTALVKKKCFLEMGGFDEELRIVEDYDLWLRFATRYKFLHHPQKVFCYCVAGPRLSGNVEKAVAANYKILARFFKTYPEACTANDKRKAWASFYRWSVMAAKHTGSKASWGDLFRATAMTPLDFRNWRLLAKKGLRRL